METGTRTLVLTKVFRMNMSQWALLLLVVVTISGCGDKPDGVLKKQFVLRHTTARYGVAAGISGELIIASDQERHVLKRYRIRTGDSLGEITFGSRWMLDGICWLHGTDCCAVWSISPDFAKTTLRVVNLKTNAVRDIAEDLERIQQLTWQQESASVNVLTGYGPTEYPLDKEFLGPITKVEPAGVSLGFELSLWEPRPAMLGRPSGDWALHLKKDGEDHHLTDNVWNDSYCAFADGAYVACITRQNESELKIWSTQSLNLIYQRKLGEYPLLLYSPEVDHAYILDGNKDTATLYQIDVKQLTLVTL